MSSDPVFEKIKNQLLLIDPVHFIETYLKLDGKPYRINKNGYKPLSDIIRTIGIKCLEKNSLPVVICKGRQIGLTSSSAALEMYFMGCGLFGNANNPPFRIIHAFPQLDLAAYYGKVKLSGMMNESILIESNIKGQKSKPYMQSLLDPSSSGNDNQQFKQFIGGNHIIVESVGLDAQRLRGKTADCIFFDECLVYDTYIEIENGKEKIGKLVNNFLSKNKPIKVKTFNEKTEQFEYKNITNAWERKKRISFS